MEPVQAFKRSGRGAIGAYGSERPGAADVVSIYNERLCCICDIEIHHPEIVTLGFHG